MIDIDTDKLGTEYKKVRSYLSYYKEYGEPLVEEYSKTLDEKTDAITQYLTQCREYNLDFDVPSMQRICLDLSSTIYYTSSRLQQVELLADMAKISYKDKYNDIYTSTQKGARQEDRKYTGEQLRALAETGAIEEELVHFIYSHAADIIKSKIDAANEMLKVCSKILSSLITEMQQFGLQNKTGA